MITSKQINLSGQRTESQEHTTKKKNYHDITFDVNAAGHKKEDPGFSPIWKHF